MKAEEAVDGRRQAEQQADGQSGRQQVGTGRVAQDAPVERVDEEQSQIGEVPGPETEAGGTVQPALLGLQPAESGAANDDGVGAQPQAEDENEEQIAGTGEPGDEHDE